MPSLLLLPSRSHAPPRRSHKLAPLFSLIFRRSSCQHPLLAGALGRITEDKANCELIAKEEVALQQVSAAVMASMLPLMLTPPSGPAARLM